MFLPFVVVWLRYVGMVFLIIERKTSLRCEYVSIYGRRITGFAMSGDKPASIAEQGRRVKFLFGIAGSRRLC